jgi:hypothetical protein
MFKIKVDFNKKMNNFFFKRQETSLIYTIVFTNMFDILMCFFSTLPLHYHIGD